VKRVIAALILCALLWTVAVAQDITLSDTLWLRKATHIDYDLGSWDTVFVDIMRGPVQVERVFLSSNGKGRWGGFYVPSYRGSFVAEYNAVYSEDTIVEEQYFTVLDTAAFRGAAAGLTAPDIADELESRGLLGTGTGAFACTVQVRDSSLEGGIYRATVLFKNSAQTTSIAASETNADGFAWFHLDSLGTGASYKLWIGHSDYNFTFPETLDLRGDTTVVFYGTAFDPGSPPSANQCRVYDQVFDIEADSLSGVLIAVKLEVPEDSVLRYDGFPVSPYKKTYTTTASGRWHFDLIPNADYLPSGTKYIFRFQFPSNTGPYFIYEDTTEVPDEETARYRDISGRM
jgi:hypothetical protein